MWCITIEYWKLSSLEYLTIRLVNYSIITSLIYKKDNQKMFENFSIQL